jgi:hypothetical protein
MWSIVSLLWNVSAVATNAFQQQHYFPARSNSTPTTIVTRKSQRRLMVGGRGWDNSDYLSSLSGDNDDRENQKETYQEFSDRQAAFRQRQEEYLKNSPQAHAFLQQRLHQEQASVPNDSMMVGEDNEDEIVYQESSGGGTRMGRMMAQADRMQAMRRNPMLGGAGGFVQKLVMPLDDDEEDGVNSDEGTATTSE